MRGPSILLGSPASRVTLFLILAMAFSTPSASAEPTRRDPLLAWQEGPSTRPATAPLVIEVHPVQDTVVAHETAWIEVRITNNSGRPIQVPFRSDKIPAEWAFTTKEGTPIVDWPREKDMKDVPRLTIGPGETLYEVLSPESTHGALTNPGTVLAFCRVGKILSAPATISRRPAREDELSALKALGPLLSNAREKAKVELWSLCGRENAGYFDCDEALFTVAWDRLLVAPTEAQAIVDSLIALDPDSGWCRPALFSLVVNMPAAAGQRYLESMLARESGGVAGAYTRELIRRAGHKQCPSAEKGRK